MGAKGLIGDVHAAFTADTAEFQASVNSASDALLRMRKAGASTAAAIDAASAKMQAASRAQTLAHDRAVRAWEKELDANALAASKASQAAAAAEELARAQEMAALKADILSRAEEQVGLSTIPAIRGMQMFAATARETMGATAERITMVAEKAELSSDGIASAFGGLGALLGAGIGASFLTHTLDNLAELNVRLEDLREKTGMSVQELAGLRLIAQSKGLEFSTISRGLARLATAIYNAKRGSSEAVDAFGSLGITMKEVESPTFTLTTAFYKIAAAAGKYHSVALTTATAQKLFGRGGRELVPILQAYGAGLQEAVRQQGALTGMTDKSAAAAHRWLVATTDLSAELHGAMVPALEGFVAALPFVEAGLRGMQLVFEDVFESIALAINSGTAGVVTLIRALNDLGHMDPAAAWRDMKAGGKYIASGAAGWNADNKAAAVAMQADWHEGMHPPKGKLYEYNRSVTPQGMLTSPYGPAQRKLTQMELSAKAKGRPMTAQQIIGYWQGVLAKTQRDSPDYIKISNLLASYAEDPNRAAYLGGSAAKASTAMTALTRSAPRGNASDAYGYWARHAASLPAGSPEQQTSAANAARAYRRVREQQAAYRAEAVRQALIFYPSRNLLTGQTQSPGRHSRDVMAASLIQQDHLDLSKSPSFVRGAKASSGSVVDWVQAQTRLRQTAAQVEASMIKMRTASALAAGQITKLDAATVMAALHQQEYSQGMAEFDAQIASIQHGVAGSGMTGTQRRAAVARVRAQRLQFQSGAMQVAQRDAMATGQFQPGSTMVAVKNALDQFVIAVRDSSGAIADVVTGTITGVNRTLSGAIMAHSYNAWEWRRHILNAMSGQMRSAGARGLDVAMSHMEGGVLQRFGIGPKAKRGDTPMAPLYVMDVSAAKGAAGAAGIVGAMTKLGAAHATGGIGSVLGSVFQGFFANGGTIRSGLPAMVGERGPELFVPHSAGRIVPNHKLMAATAAGDTHIHVDATGATNPAAVHRVVYQAIQAAAPHLVAASVRAVHEHHTRIPTNRKY